MPALTIVAPVYVFAPLSVTVPAPVLVRPCVPASAALALPACASNVVALVSVPFAMLPPASCTPLTVSPKPPRSKVPPLTTSAVPFGSRSLAPSCIVPALTVVLPV